MHKIPEDVNSYPAEGYLALIMRGIEKANHNKEGAPYQYAVGMLHDTENGIRYEIQAGIRIPCRTTGRAPNPVLHNIQTRKRS